MSFQSYTIDENLLHTIRNASEPKTYGVYCLGDGFTDQTGINAGASSNLLYDPRHAVCPTRSQNETIGTDNTQSLSGWTPIHSGTGTVSTVADANNPVSPGANVFLFDTGSQLGSVAGAQKNFGTIPDAKFSIGVHIDIETTGTNPLDAFEGQIASVSGYNLQYRAYSGSLEIFQDGAWQQLSTYGGGNLYTEWWLNAVQISGDDYTVTLNAGTQQLASRSGHLPGGGNPGLVVFQKNSGATANQSSRIAYVNVGASQLADNLTLVSTPAQGLLTSPTNCRLIVLVEDTSVALNTNVNITGSVSQNGGVVWEPVTFTDIGTFGYGVIDDTKPVHMLAVDHVFTNSGAMAPCYKIESSGNWWFSIMGAYLEWY